MGSVGLAVAAAIGGLVAGLRGQPVTGVSVQRRAAQVAPRARPALTTDCRSSDALEALSRPQDREFLPWVEWKYGTLLAELEASACARQDLRALLAARERASRDAESEGSRDELDRIEGHLSDLIPSADHADYEALRRSDAEHRRLDDYAAGMEHVAPLSDEQRTAILRAKLDRKRTFEDTVRESGLHRPSLTDDERVRAQAIVQEALDRYRDDFLADASEVLDAEQLRFLSNYETTEFEHDSEQLQIAINAR